MNIQEELEQRGSTIASLVDRIFRDCLYRNDELKGLERGLAPAGAVLVDGLQIKAGLHPQRLESHKANIAAICNLMPDSFQKTRGGGGMTFLNLCQTADGNQWGEHLNCDQLVCLAIATNQGGFALPRDMWGVLPGGMPYVWFDTVS